MSENATTYDVILRRQDVAEFVSGNLQVFKRAFAALDDLAVTVKDHDGHLMELINSLADLLRGSLAERHGMDITPTSDIGPYEPVDINHTLRILTELVVSDSIDGVSRRLISERERLEFFEQATAIEEGLLAIEADLQKVSLASGAEVIDRMKHSIARMRTNRLLTNKRAAIAHQAGLPAE